tara:strand:- start:406 stop:582 length:177 start_codon:yes stop_codon:yes gene_type:complete
MMIELANRINYLEDKLKDLQSKERTLIANINILKHRVQELEDKIIPEHLDVKSYGGSK